jgi:hypothetical protein
MSGRVFPVDARSDFICVSTAQKPRPRRLKAARYSCAYLAPDAFDGRNASTVAESRLSLFAMPRHRRRWK